DAVIRTLAAVDGAAAPPEEAQPAEPVARPRIDDGPPWANERLEFLRQQWLNGSTSHTTSACYINGLVYELRAALAAPPAVQARAQALEEAARLVDEAAWRDGVCIDPDADELAYKIRALKSKEGV